MTITRSGRDQDRMNRRATLLRRRRVGAKLPDRIGDLCGERKEPHAALKAAAVGVVCLGLGIGTGYLLWGTRTMELARQVPSLKATMAEHARDAIAERTELEAQLWAAKLELARLRAQGHAEAARLAPTSHGPPAGIEPEVARTPPSPPVPSPRRQPPSSAPLPRHTTEGTGAYDSALKRSDGRLRRAPLELPRRPPDPSPDFRGWLPRPTSP
jgi:hypothetical protein